MLCELCVLVFSAAGEERYGYDPSYTSLFESYKHHLTFSSLEKAVSEGCRLCTTVLSYIPAASLSEWQAAENENQYSTPSDYRTESYLHYEIRGNFEIQHEWDTGQTRTLVSLIFTLGYSRLVGFYIFPRMYCF